MTKRIEKLIRKEVEKELDKMTTKKDIHYQEIVEKYFTEDESSNNKKGKCTRK